MKKIAMITGSSSGIGEAFSDKLAELGYNLILVARNEARLNNQKNDIEKRYGQDVKIISADISSLDGIHTVENAIKNTPNLYLLVNNAGFVTNGRFLDIDIEKTVSMINLHIMSLTRFCHAASHVMKENGSGQIINVSSMGAYSWHSGDVNYNASKLYVNLFSKRLSDEVKPLGIKIQALCPGYTHTNVLNTKEFRGKADHSQSLPPEWAWMYPSEVVEKSISRMSNRAVVVFPSRIVNFLVICMKYKWSWWLVENVFFKFKRKAK